MKKRERAKRSLERSLEPPVVVVNIYIYIYIYIYTVRQMIIKLIMGRDLLKKSYSYIFGDLIIWTEQNVPSTVYMTVKYILVNKLFFFNLNISPNIPKDYFWSVFSLIKLMHLSQLEIKPHHTIHTCTVEAIASISHITATNIRSACIVTNCIWMTRWS